jgi:hypothetical protein
MGTDGAGGGFYRRGACEVVLGCGVVVMEQVPRDSRRDKGKGAGVAGGECAAKGAWGGGSAHGGGHACGGTGEWWGR